MARSIATFLLFLATLAPLHGAEREIFPDDYKPSPCAPKKACVTFQPSELQRAGARIHALTNMKARWIDAHWNELVEAFAPYCEKVKTCYAQPGNTNLFCDDQLVPLVLPLCDRYADSEDREQCTLFYRAYLAGLMLNSEKPWLEAQDCAKASAQSGQPLRKLEVWMDPATVPRNFKGKLTVYAIDSESRVPLEARVTIGDENLWADTPGGRPATGFVLKWKTKLVRVPNSEGHHDVVAPTVKIEKEGYETVTFPMPIELRKMIVEMTPAPGQLKRGRNTVTVTAKDSVTGEPVEGRVMIGFRDTADIGQPFELELKRGEKRPEIWVRSPFNLYSDTIVAPAEK